VCFEKYTQPQIDSTSKTAIAPLATQQASLILALMQTLSMSSELGFNRSYRRNAGEAFPVPLPLAGKLP
jgi:hypothetical protein